MKRNKFMIKKIKTVGLLILVGLVSSLSGCAAKDDTIPDLPVEQLYMTGYQNFQDKNYAEAARYFDEIERQHPYSIWSPRAQIMAAYAYYTENKYDDAILTLDRFIQLHPGNRNIAYAYYLKGLCFYEQMSDVTREQKITEEALNTFNELIFRYPNSVYVKDVNVKLKEIAAHLAGKEMAIARYYLKNEEFIPAMNRFQNVILDYSQGEHIPEAFYRLAVCYTSLGIMPQVEKISVLLNKNYPQNTWAQKAQKLIQEHKKEK